MSALKRTQLYDVHVAAGASMVDFGGWEMPIQYPSGIVAEHLYTRHACSLFDVSHMGRVLVEGPDRVSFLQHVLSSNVESLDLNMAQYCIIPTENGTTEVHAQVPLSEMFGYATAMRSKPQGRGQYSMEPDEYKEVPKSIAEQIISNSAKTAD